MVDFKKITNELLCVDCLLTGFGTAFVLDVAMDRLATSPGTRVDFGDLMDRVTAGALISAGSLASKAVIGAIRFRL